jgi:hypothetical protein
MAMKRSAYAALALSALFLVFFLVGITDFGQVLLRGQIPQNASPPQLDDIWMGAGLAPWVFGLAPCVLLALVGTVLLVSQRLKPR